MGLRGLFFNPFASFYEDKMTIIDIACVFPLRDFVSFIINLTEKGSILSLKRDLIPSDFRHFTLSLYPDFPAVGETFFVVVIIISFDVEMSWNGRKGLVPRVNTAPIRPFTRCRIQVGKLKLVKLGLLQCRTWAPTHSFSFLLLSSLQFISYGLPYLFFYLLL